MKNAFNLPFLPIELDSEKHLKLMRIVVRVKDRLNELNNLCAMIPTDLASVLTLAESVQSTKIEGTQATFDEVMEAEAIEKDNKKVDVQEVLNYRSALNLGVERIVENDYPLSVSLIRQIHAEVLNNSRGARRDPGEFRRIQNWIGSSAGGIDSADYIPPVSYLVPDLMGNLEKFINEPNDEFDPLIMAGIIHAQFESIHPFLDGNGRVGRLLITLFLLKKGVCGENKIFVSEELERNKYKYYSMLNGLRTENPKWFEWLEFFLTSIENQAKKQIIKANKISYLLDKYWNDEEIQNSNAAQKILLCSFSSPVFTARNIQNKSGYTNATINKWLKYFVSKGIVYSNNKKRNIVYRNYELLDIVNN
ncbi:Fic family protein [Neisseriaceae bacterium ESL0693]|nr:Fic family protein [Neisseriaceae bacterium ESL0693]